MINIKRQRGDTKEKNVRGIGFQTSGADVAAKPWVLTPATTTSSVDRVWSFFTRGRRKTSYSILF